LRRCIWLVALLTVLVAPTAATAATVDPGAVVRFTYTVLPTNVASLTATLVFPRDTQLEFVSEGSTPSRVVDGRVTWTRHNLKSTGYIYFNVRVKRSAPRGRRQLLWLETVAATGDWTRRARIAQIIHVR
jgi:hypothetical protein